MEEIWKRSLDEATIVYRFIDNIAAEGPDSECTCR